MVVVTQVPATASDSNPLPSPSVGVFQGVQLYGNPMNNISLNQSVAIGAGIGLTAAALMFTYVPWYHNLVVWSWTNPWLWTAAITTGIVLAYLDKD